MGNRMDNPHPWNQIPCLKDNDIVIFESGAILMYLADKYNQKEMG
jgi:glutathione S-transferase